MRYASLVSFHESHELTEGEAQRRYGEFMACQDGMKGGECWSPASFLGPRHRPRPSRATRLPCKASLTSTACQATFPLSSTLDRRKVGTGHAS